MQRALPVAEHDVRRRAEQDRCECLRRGPQEGAHPFGATPQRRDHDVEPGGVERRVLRREPERRHDEVRQRPRRDGGSATPG